MMDDR